MRMELGATVRTLDDQTVGTIDRLIVDPASGAVKAAAIREGGLLGKDVEVLLTDLTTDNRGVVRLNRTAEQVDDLPKFFESNYTTTPPPGYDAAPLDYPAGGLFWPVGYGAFGMPAAPWVGPTVEPGLGAEGNAEIYEALRREDVENAVIGEGSEVKSRDGEKVGEVHRLVFDADTGAVTGLVVRKGFIFTKDIELPARLIASADDGVIYLAANAAELQV